MNTANRPDRVRSTRQAAPVGLALRPAAAEKVPTWPERPSFCPPGTHPNETGVCVVAPAASPVAEAAKPSSPAPATPPVSPPGNLGMRIPLANGSNAHPLIDKVQNERLAHYERTVRDRFDGIVPALKQLAALQHEPDFEVRAQAIARDRLGFEVPATVLADAWVTTLDMRALYGYSVLHTFRDLAQSTALPQASGAAEADAMVRFLIECGFHEVDLSPCADGRLKGLLQYILRLPNQAVGHLQSYAGAMFDVEGNVKKWTHTELRRHREGVPTLSDAGTRYLKIAVYHFSSSDPLHEGCAAHGSDERNAAAAALARLDGFRTAIENGFCCGASVATLLIGVDTDTDAIKIHIPDGNGQMSLYRLVDNASLFDATANMPAQRAAEHVFAVIDKTARQDGWGRGEGLPAAGMRNLVARLLVNNLSQIQYVRDYHGGRYRDIGHQERFICVGEGFDELQLRNLTYLAQMHTVEEGAADIDVGIKIFTMLNVTHDLPIPIAIHYRYDAGVPESRERAIERCRRVKSALTSRFSTLMRRRLLICGLTVQDRQPGSLLEIVVDDNVAAGH